MHNHKPLIMLVMFTLLMSFSSGVLAQDAISPGDVVESTLKGEPRTYSLDATAGQLLIVSMVSEFDNRVILMQADEEIAADDDSGEEYNALLAYVIQTDGTYDIVADSSFFDDPEGPFTMTVDTIDPPMVEMGSAVTLEPAEDGSAQLYAVVEAAADDVIDVWATNMAEDEDVEISIIGVDSVEIESDDDDGPGNNALLRRVVLPDDGLYLIKAEASFSDEMLFQPVEVMVESTEALFLSEEPQDLVLGDGTGEIGTEVYTVEMEAGTTYRFVVTITPQSDELLGINMELLDTDKFFEPEIDVQHGVGVTWDYLATSNGTVRLDVHPGFFSTDVASIEYTMALEVIE